MYEKLVEDWLTSANELTYQIPFCEVLVAEGFELLHISRHGRGEHGKDVVASTASGELWAFQLKGGDITLSDWHAIRGEIEELVQLPLRLPGIDENRPYRPVLVTNGELRGDAIESVKQFADLWHRQGFPHLEVWSKGTLVRRFLDAQGSFLPTRLTHFRRFVELYVGDFKEQLPTESFTTFMELLVDAIEPSTIPLRKRRALAAVALVAGYIAGQYEREGNYLACAKLWTIAAANIFYVATRDGLSRDVYGPSLELVRLAYTKALDSFAEEVLKTEHFVVSHYGLADPYVYGVRVTVTLAWLSVWSLDGLIAAGQCLSPQLVLDVIKREYKRSILVGEVDWPFLMSIALFLDRQYLARDAENVIERLARIILRMNRDPGADGFASPYWDHSRVIRMACGMLPPYEAERFGGHTYVLEQAMDMLTRRLRRQLIASIWPGATHLQHCDFVPDHHSGYFRWRCGSGTLRLQQPVRSRSWAEWRKVEAKVDVAEVPIVLTSHPEWTLPFLLSFPHRANKSLSRFADLLVSRRDELV